jgi:hypothetical protein
MVFHWIGSARQEYGLSLDWICSSGIRSFIGFWMVRVQVLFVSNKGTDHGLLSDIGLPNDITKMRR